MEAKTIILESKKIDQKIIRIAHEIAEFNYDQPGVILIGIVDRGYQLAERLVSELAKYYDQPAELGRLFMDKHDPVNCEYRVDIPLEQLEGKSVILVDDVLESGRTLIYAAKFLLGANVKKLTTVVLVDRMHPKFPITADFVGMTLSTTVQEHIYVDLTPGEEA
ncbi:MAG: phosphoribosyltransferase family protein, partial [Bacteroidota bacterium]